MKVTEDLGGERYLPSYFRNEEKALKAAKYISQLSNQIVRRVPIYLFMNVWLCISKHKNEAFMAYKQLETWIESQTGKGIKRLRTDEGRK